MAFALVFCWLCLEALRPLHLENILSCLEDDYLNHLCIAMAAPISHMHSGEIPNQICAYLCGIKVAAFKKKDGGNSPLAVESTLRRLANRIAVRRTKLSMGETLIPIKVGLAAPQGAEAIIVHAVEVYIKESLHEECRVVLKLDLDNSFNTSL